VLANDPDADRLAVAERQPSGQWQMFSGNEIGMLLAHWLMIKARERGAAVEKLAVVASTVRPTAHTVPRTRHVIRALFSQGLPSTHSPHRPCPLLPGAYRARTRHVIRALSSLWRRVHCVSLWLSLIWQVSSKMTRALAQHEAPNYDRTSPSLAPPPRSTPHAGPRP
jgi:hypothetical protein